MHKISDSNLRISCLVILLCQNSTDVNADFTEAVYVLRTELRQFGLNVVHRIPTIESNVQHLRSSRPIQVEQCTSTSYVDFFVSIQNRLFETAESCIRHITRVGWSAVSDDRGPSRRMVRNHIQHG